MSWAALTVFAVVSLGWVLSALADWYRHAAAVAALEAGEADIDFAESGSTWRARCPEASAADLRTTALITTAIAVLVVFSTCFAVPVVRGISRARFDPGDLLV